jgi:hypothetical protein
MESLHLLYFAEQSMAGTELGIGASLLTFCWSLRRLIAIILKNIQDVGLDVAARSPPWTPTTTWVDSSKGQMGKHDNHSRLIDIVLSICKSRNPE